MNVQQLVAMQPAIKVLAEAKLPVKASYRVAKALKLIAAELATYEEARQKLLNELGVVSEDKTQYLFPEEGAREKFDAALAILLDEEVDLRIQPLMIDELGDVYLDAATMYPLIGLFLEE